MSLLLSSSLKVIVVLVPSLLIVVVVGGISGVPFVAASASSMSSAQSRLEVC